LDEQLDKAIELGKNIREKAVETGKKVQKKVQDVKIGEMSLEDIADMSNAKIKELVKKVDPDQLFTVLEHASDDVRNRIIPNLGVRARKKYDEFKKDIRSIKKSDIRKYTDNIEKEIKNLFK
jgi:flagellar motor switch protein FliG